MDFKFIKSKFSSVEWKGFDNGSLENLLKIDFVVSRALKYKGYFSNRLSELVGKLGGEEFFGKIRSLVVSEGFSFVLISIGVLLVAAFLLIFSVGGEFFGNDLSAKTDVFGQLGDIVGGVVGSMWALAGVILFYTGLKDQREDIKINRDALRKQVDALNYQKTELELQTREYRNANSVYRDQSITLRKQQFESNFYSLLNIYGKVRDEVFSKEKVDAYDFICSREEGGGKVDINESYLLYYHEERELLSKYFGMLYRVLKTIDSSYLDGQDKDFYAKIMRTMLSERELLVLYYNSHSVYGDSIYPLVLKYNLLKSLSPLAKVEFKDYRGVNVDEEVNLRVFLEWLDKFLISSMFDVYALDKDDGFKSVSQCVLLRDSIIELDMEELFDFKIYLPILESSSILGMDIAKFSKFIELYIEDRFFYSCFKSVEVEDVIETLVYQDGEYVVVNLTISTGKELGITEDEYGE